MKNSTLISLSFFLITFLSSAQGISDQINNQLAALVANNELLLEDIQWELSSDHISRTSGVHHIYYSQIFNDIEVFGSQSSLHILEDGIVLSATNNFIFKSLPSPSYPKYICPFEVSSAFINLNGSTSLKIGIYCSTSTLW